jgi:hypothetical protein
VRTVHPLRVNRSPLQGIRRSRPDRPFPALQHRTFQTGRCGCRTPRNSETDHTSSLISRGSWTVENDLVGPARTGLCFAPRAFHRRGFSALFATPPSGEHNALFSLLSLLNLLILPSLGPCRKRSWRLPKGGARLFVSWGDAAEGNSAAIRFYASIDASIGGGRIYPSHLNARRLNQFRVAPHLMVRILTSKG